MKKLRLPLILAALVLLAVGLGGQPWFGTGDGPGVSLIDEAIAQGGPPGGGGGGPNLPPVADAGHDRRVFVSETPLPVTILLDGSGSHDPDGSQLTDNDAGTPHGILWRFVSVPVGSTAALSTTTTIRSSFVLDQPGDYVVEFVVNDGTTEAIDAVTISTVGVAPVADAGRDQKVTLSDAVFLDASGSSDGDGDTLSYSWSVSHETAGAVAVSDPTAAMPSFSIDQAGDYTATLTVNDGVSVSEADHVLVSTVNVPPVSVPNAGEDWVFAIPLPVVELETLILEAEGTSDLDDDALSYRWAVAWGPDGVLFALEDAETRRAGLTPLDGGDWALQLTVDDGTATHDETFLITTGNITPTAHAGADQEATLGQVVELDGTGSTDNNDDAISYRWALISKPAGSLAALDDISAGRPSFGVDLPGTYIAQLIVSDATSASTADTVVITTDANLAPVADAGPDHFEPALGNVIQLDGTGSSDANNDALTYRWTLMERANRSSAALSDTTSPTPTFVPDKNGFYIIQLVVSDGITESAADTIHVSAKGGGGNVDVILRPISEGGAPVVQIAPALVQLDGSGSVNPNAADPITYRWALTHAPDGSAAALSSTTAINPTFTTDLGGIYVAQLIVSDATFDSIADTVVVQLNLGPVADAGPDQTVTASDLVTLDGTGSSDPNSNPLTYAWTLTSVPVGSTAALDDPTSATPSFTADLAGSYQVDLIVNNGTADSDPDTVIITANPNNPPVANAGPDQNVTAGNSVYLDGTGSSDPDSQAITYAWTFTDKPVGSLAAFDDATAAVARFSADLTGIYTAELVVNDGALSSPPDSATITANANVAPVLTAVGNQSIDLGLTLNINLQGSDANNDPLIFAGLSLPDNASLNAATGAFSFQPDANQIGDHAVTFLVTDGLLADAETITITVVGAPVGGTTALSGRLVDANDTVTPIVGASVNLKESGLLPAITDSNGDFTLSNAPAGVQILQVDSTNAAPSPDEFNPRYSNFREEIELIADVTNVIERPIYLPRIDDSSGGTVTIGDPNPTFVINADLGVTLEIAAGTAVLEDGVTPFGGVIYVSEVPLAFAPVALPEMLQPGLLLSIQASAIDENGDIVPVFFTQPVQITFPNNDNMPAGSEVDIYSLEAATGSFFITGTGVVSADGSQIEMLSGGIMATTWHFASPPMPNGEEEPDPDNPCDCSKVPSGSQTAVGPGKLIESHNLASYRSFGQSRALNFVYNSTSADPRPIIETSVTIPFRSAVPNTISTRLTVAGVQQGNELHTSTTLGANGQDPLSENIDETIRLAVQFDASGLATGLYPYQMMQTNNFDTSSVSATVNDTVLVNNEIGSPFGAGWTLSGLQRIHPQQGSVILTGGTGSVMRYEPVLAADGGFSAPVTVGTGINTQAFAIGDLDGDGDPDMAVPSSSAGELEIFLNDGSGTYTTRRTYFAGSPAAGGNNTIAAAIGDFNNDGIADVAVANAIDQRVSVHMGTGAGFFAPATFLSPGNNVFSVGIADFNGDGNDDIAASWGFGELEVFRGDGAGGFPTSTNHAVGQFPLSLHVDDVSGDGLPDIITANDNGTVTVLRNDGAGGFVRSDPQAGAIINNVGKWFIDIADLNGDGNKDIVVANTPDSTISVLLGTGGGGFAPRTAYPVGFLPNSVALGDFNGDGIPDAAAVSDLPVVGVGGAIGIKLGDGLGGFGPTTNFAMNNGCCAQSIRAGDLDIDGLVDVVAAANPMEIHFGLPSATTAYASPAGDFSTLVQNVDSTFIRTLKTGTRIEFDAAGFQTAIIDRNGNTTAYGYNGQDQLTTITDPANLVTTLAYGGDSKLDTVTDPASRVTTFAHDGNGDLASITDPDLSVRGFAYDARHRLVTQTSKRGFDTAYQYGFHGRNVRADRPDNSFALVSPSEVVAVIDNGSGLGTASNPALYVRPDEVEASFTDGEGNVTRYTVGPFGAATQQIDALSRVTDTVRDANNLTTSITSAAGTPEANTVSFTYDTMGNVLTSTEETTGATVSATYDPVFNLVATLTDPNNNPPTTTVRDGNGNPIDVTDVAGTLTTIGYGEPACPGLPTTLTAAVGLPEQTVSSISYDPVTCNRVSLFDAAGTETRFTYDGAGSVLTRTDAFGTPQARTSQFFYDAMGRLDRHVDPNLDETLYDFDDSGNLATVTDPNLNVTSFDYDSRDRFSRKVDPLLAEETYIYDNNGNLLSVTDRKLQTNSIDYDPANRPITQTLPGGFVRTFGYDLRNRLVSLTDPNSTITKTYDGVGRILTTSTTGSPNQPDVTLTYTYDLNGNRLTMDDDLFGVTDYVSNPVNQLTSISAPGQAAIGFQHDVLYRRVGITRPNGVDSTFDHDTRSLLTSIDHTLGLSTVSSFAYGHTEVANRMNVNQVRSAVSVTPSVTFDYDAADQLTSATHPVPASPTETFTYDPAGNRLRRDGEVTDSIIGVGNQLTEDALYTYVYDANGNLETRTRKSNSDVTTYTWNSENLLVRIDFPDLSFASYVYDGFGRRIVKNDNGQITRYVYDGNMVLFEYDGSNALLARYTQSPIIDEPLVMERDGDGDQLFAANERFYYLADGVGSITDITDQFGTVVRAYVYDSFGDIVQETGTLANPYTYSGRERDEESGLYYYRARYFDAAAGRFISEDPIGFGGLDTNLYRYVFNNPINRRDPVGLDSVWVGGGGNVSTGYSVEVNVGGVYNTTTGEFDTFVQSGVGIGCCGATADFFVNYIWEDFVDLEAATTTNVNIYIPFVTLTVIFNGDPFVFDDFSIDDLFPIGAGFGVGTPTAVGASILKTQVKLDVGQDGGSGSDASSSGGPCSCQ